MSMLLFEACQRGDTEQLKTFINENFDLNQLDEQGRSALHHCCESTNIDCAKILLENELIKNQFLNLKDNEGCSPLHLACMNGNENLVKFLCEQGANVEIVDNESHSLIHWITVCGHLHLFDILLQYKAPFHTADIYSAFPIHYASQLSGVSENDDLKIDPNKGLEILQKFIDRKVDIDCIDGQNRTPFMWAASTGAVDAVRLLYKYGANQLHVDKDCLTALHCAATRGHLPCVKMLVEQCGCPIEGEDINGCTALFYAITLNQIDICQLLLELKANPNHKDKYGRTPSHCAILKGNLNCLKLLIKFKGNIWLKNKRGDYPIHETILTLSNKKLLKNEYCEVIRYIFQLYPNKINIQNDEHRTPLHLAASLGDIDTCKLLIECGALINSLFRTSSGNYLTPYDLARIRNQNECADYLALTHGGQRGNLLVNILARRIQKSYRNYSKEKKDKIDDSPTKNTLLKQAKICLDNKKFDDRIRSKSLHIQTLFTSDDNNAQERRRVFAKSKTTTTTTIPINQSNEIKTDSENKIIVHTSNSIATSNKLYDRRKLIQEELHKLRQARLHNHYIVINRPLYKILIENAFNPQNRRADEIEQYLETLAKAYDTELEAIKKRSKSMPPKANRRVSQLF